MKQHHYQTTIEWTGNEGKGTQSYRSYSRNHSIQSIHKYQEILASSEPAFRGDPSRYNPEELFLASISSCHMLWYLHLCSANKIVVTEYIDHAKGTMEEAADGSGRFTSVVLQPTVKITDKTKIDLANHLHEAANKMCFIANSCNFKILHQAQILTVASKKN